MSTETLDTPIEKQDMSSDFDSYPHSPDEEFVYRPLSSLAVCSLVLGLFSLLGIFLWMVIPVGLLAVVLGGIAILSIRRQKGEYTGTGVAIVGILFGLITMAAGTAPSLPWRCCALGWVAWPRTACRVWMRTWHKHKAERCFTRCKRC